MYIGEYLLAVAGSALWLYLPAYFANGSAVVGGHLCGKPIDGGRTRSDGTRILGDGKTWGGLIFGTFIAFVVGVVEFFLMPYLPELEFLAPHVAPKFQPLIGYGFPLIVPVRATVAGLGALTGDIVKSYFKRKIGIKRGEKFIPWDQIDFILGSTLFMLPFATNVNFLWTFLFMLVFTPPVHLGTNIIAYKLGLKDNPW